MEDLVSGVIAGPIKNMKPADIQELTNLLMAMINSPCRHGHVFTYASSSTWADAPPPNGLTCACGLMMWMNGKAIKR